MQFVKSLTYPTESQFKINPKNRPIFEKKWFSINSPFKFQNGGPFCFSLALPTIYRYLTKLFVVLTQSPLLAKQEIFWPIFHNKNL